MIRALLFDLDNTLYHYAPCNEAALSAAHTVCARSVNVTAADFLELHDQVRQELAKRLKGQAASHNRILFFKLMVERLTVASRASLALELFDCYWRVFLEEMKPAPDALDVLGILGGSYDLALVSNHTTDIQLRKIRRLDMERHFSVVVTSEECGAEKPAEVVFERALTALGVEASQAVMIGDDPVSDIQGAREVGLLTVLTTEFSGESSDEAQAGAVIGSIGQLPALLANGFQT